MPKQLFVAILTFWLVFVGIYFYSTISNYNKAFNFCQEKGLSLQQFGNNYFCEGYDQFLATK